MKSKIISINSMPVLILNRECPKSCMLFLEYLADLDINVYTVYKITKNDFDYTFEIASDIKTLEGAKTYINNNLL